MTPYMNYLISEIRAVPSWDITHEEGKRHMSHIHKILALGLFSVGHETLATLVHTLLTPEQRYAISFLYADHYKQDLYLILPPTCKETWFDHLFRNRVSRPWGRGHCKIQSQTLPELVAGLFKHSPWEGLGNDIRAAWLLYHVLPEVSIDGHYIQRFVKIITRIKYPDNPLRDQWYLPLSEGTATSEQIRALLLRLKDIINVPPRKPKT